MKRFLLGLIGTLLLLAGLAGATGAGWVLSIFGSDGSYEEPVAKVDTNSAALYVNMFNVTSNVTSDLHLPRDFFTTYVQARSNDGKPIFLGVGPADKVQDFLFGVPYVAASSLANGAFVTRDVPGDTLPAPTPATAGIWSVSAVGSQPKLQWSPDNAAGVFVVMNGDGTAGVHTQLVATLESPRLLPALAIAAAVSVLFAVVGIVLLVLAFRSGSRRRNDG